MYRHPLMIATRAARLNGQFRHLRQAGGGSVGNRVLHAWECGIAVTVQESATSSFRAEAATRPQSRNRRPCRGLRSLYREEEENQTQITAQSAFRSSQALSVEGPSLGTTAIPRLRPFGAPLGMTLGFLDCAPPRSARNDTS